MGGWQVVMNANYYKRVEQALSYSIYYTRFDVGTVRKTAPLQWSVGGKILPLMWLISRKKREKPRKHMLTPCR